MTTLSDPIQTITLDPREVTFYQNEGYLLIPNLIDPDVVDALHRETLEVLSGSGADLSGSKLSQSQKYLRGSALESLVHSPRLCQVAAQLLGGPSTVYMPFTAVKSASGGGEFEFHQDNQYTLHDGHSLNLWIALQEMTPENGCLRIEPRSHLAGTLESTGSRDGDGHRRVLQDPEDQYLVRMRPGDCVAFTRLTVHGSGPNTTDEHRVGYAVQYHRDDVMAHIDGEWKLLKEHPRWQFGPVDSLAE